MKKWEKKEQKDARLFQGRRQTGSGNKWYAPGDCKTDVLLIDSKQTDKKSYSVSIETWDKLYEEALFAQRIPVLSLEIQKTSLVVLDLDDFLPMIKKLGIIK